MQREPVLHDGVFGNSIGEVEDLIRKHDDFEKTILAHQDLFEGLKKLTLVNIDFFISTFSLCTLKLIKVGLLVRRTVP